MRRHLASLAVASLALAACASTGEGERTSVGPEAPAAAVGFSLQPVDFGDLPGWQNADLAPALLAFRRACDGRRARDPSAALPGEGRYGGRVGDWAPACTAAQNVASGGERAFFEANFQPYEVRGEGEARLTSYYEPVIEARRTPQGAFTAPLLRRPTDMVTVDVAAFAEAYDNEALRGAPRRLTGQINGAEVRPYPKRDQLTPYQGQAFAYAHPVDVYNLQIQGSGRIAFPDGTQARAAYASRLSLALCTRRLARQRTAAGRRHMDELPRVERSERPGRDAASAERRSFVRLLRRAADFRPSRGPQRRIGRAVDAARLDRRRSRVSSVRRGRVR
jgi:membrane-bound lytic murein transglycosylase A